MYMGRNASHVSIWINNAINQALLIFHFLFPIGWWDIGMQDFHADVLLNSPTIQIPISFYFMEMADWANEVIE